MLVFAAPTEDSIAASTDSADWGAPRIPRPVGTESNQRLVADMPGNAASVYHCLACVALQCTVIGKAAFRML